MLAFFRADLWEILGFAGQALFASRFFVQLIASERRRRSYFPIAFWYLSILGGMISLVYVVHLRSLPLTLAQAGGIFIYTRNLILIHRGRQEDAGPPQPA